MSNGSESEPGFIQPWMIRVALAVLAALFGGGIIGDQVGNQRGIREGKRCVQPCPCAKDGGPCPCVPAGQEKGLDRKGKENGVVPEPKAGEVE